MRVHRGVVSGWVSPAPRNGTCHARPRIVSGPPQRYAAWGSGCMLDPATAGGGSLMNLGIHAIDFVRHLSGTAVEVIGACTSNRMHGQKIEDFATAILRSKSGV